MTERKLPRITYDPKLEQAPYEVGVNLEGMADLLGEQMLSESKTGKLNIHLKRGHNHSPHGKYNVFTHRITLHTESHWDYYLRLLNPERKERISWVDALYLTSNALNNTLLHELKHYLDHNLVFTRPGVIASVALRDLIEKRAHEFADKVLADPKWEPLVTLGYKH